MKTINLRMLKPIQLSLIFSLLLMTAFGCSKHESKGQINVNLNVLTELEKWTATKDGRNYTFEYSESYFGVSLYSAYRVEVNGTTDQILKVHGITAGDVAVEIKTGLSSYLTMDKIFAKLEQLSTSNPASLEIEYFDNGGVKSYYVDSDAMMADDERGLTVSGIVFKEAIVPLLPISK